MTMNLNRAEWLHLETLKQLVQNDGAPSLIAQQLNAAPQPVRLAFIKWKTNENNRVVSNS